MQLAVVILLFTTATASTTCTTQVLPLENLVRVSLPDLTSGKISWDGSLPTMVKIDSSTKEWRALTNAWSKEQFVHDFGSTLVDTATPYDVAMYGPSQFTDHTSRPQTLRHLLNEEDDDARNNDGARNDDLMIFAGEHTRLTQLVLADHLPAKIWIDSDDGIRPLLESVVKKVVVGRTFISIAKVGQGLPFHRHGKTFTTLVSGTKRWLVAPPPLPRHVLLAGGGGKGGPGRRCEAGGLRRTRSRRRARRRARPQRRATCGAARGEPAVAAAASAAASGARRGGGGGGGGGGGVGGEAVGRDGRRPPRLGAAVPC